MRLRIGTKIDPDNPMEDGMPVFIDGKEMFQHVFQLGKTGAGKSVQLLNWIISFLISRIAVILVEPSGFLTRDVYSASRGKAIYCSLKHPIPINPMLLPYDPDTVSAIVRESINQVVSLTTDQANKQMTVKMTAIIDDSIKDCLAAGRPSLESVMDHIAGLRGDSETRDGLRSRLKYLLADSRMRQILCGNGTLDIAKIAAKGQCFLMDTHGMTTEGMTLIGNIVTQTVRSHLRHANHSTLRPLVLALDECHNFISPGWGTILKEGRKYQLSCILSSQDLTYFPQTLRETLLNVGSVTSFRVGAAVASYVSRELHIPTEDIQFEEKYVCHYLTPSQRGVALAPRPPVIRPFPLPTSLAGSTTTLPAIVSPPVIVPSQPTAINTKPMTQLHWFPIQPLPPPVTTTPEAAPVEAH